MRKFCALILLLAICVTLCGCGSNETETQATSKEELQIATISINFIDLQHIDNIAEEKLNYCNKTLEITGFVKKSKLIIAQ